MASLPGDASAVSEATVTATEAIDFTSANVVHEIAESPAATIETDTTATAPEESLQSAAPQATNGPTVPNEHGGQVSFDIAVPPSVGTAPLKKKSKRKPKNKSTEARGPTALPRSRGTGLEEYYADPPLTPQEHEEETTLYLPYLPLHDRIEECIQRFRARRRLNTEDNLVFSRYLLLGGIDATQRQFSGTRGMDIGDIENATKSEMRVMAADDVIHRGTTTSRFYSSNRSEDWEVDFYGVAAGFISHHLPILTSNNLVQTQRGITVVHKFLDYVSAHNVCPEYEDDVANARALCKRAEVESQLTSELTKKLPGDFNLACLQLFGLEDDFDVLFHAYKLDPKIKEGFEPRRAFQATIALQPELFAPGMLELAKNLGHFEVIRTTIMTLELVELLPPSAEVIKFYSGLKNKAGKLGTIRPVGRAVFKHCIIQDGWDRYHPPSNELESKTETFIIEKDLLDLLDVNAQLQRALVHHQDLLARLDKKGGLKFRLRVCELNRHLKFIKEVIEVIPSYYTFLPQELMLNYKDPVPNEREGPSVDDPYADEKQEAHNIRAEMGTEDDDKEAKSEVANETTNRA